MFRTLILICLVLKGIICGPDLCGNGAKLDSITFVKSNNMWFFTSGGHYWYVKDSEFPPKTPGQPLPGGFKKGEAAFFLDYLNNCKGTKRPDGNIFQNQEIHLLETIDGETKVMIYDVLSPSNPWSKEPISYDKIRALSKAKVDFTKTIDATFVYKGTNVVVIQGQKYSVVDVKGVCTDPNAFGISKEGRPNIELNVQTTIDATTDIKEDDYFYLFQDQIFWKVKIHSYTIADGKFITTKGAVLDVVTEFFKFQENCKLPPKDDSQTTVKPLGAGAVGAVETQPSPKDGETSTPNAADNETTQKDGGFLWIIVIVIVIIVVLIAIVLIACLAMGRKGKGDEAKAGTVGGASEAAPSGTTTSKTGTQSTTGAAAGVGASKTGSKVDASKPVSNIAGSSSAMSVRSNTEVSNSSKIGSKTGSKK